MQDREPAEAVEYVRPFPTPRKPPASVGSARLTTIGSPASAVAVVRLGDDALADTINRRAKPRGPLEAAPSRSFQPRCTYDCTRSS